MSAPTTAVTAVQDTLSAVTTISYTKPDPWSGVFHCAVVGAALEGDCNPVIVVHHRSVSTITLHLAGARKVDVYDENSFDNLLVSHDFDGHLLNVEMFASPGQADYARRVLTLMLEALPDRPGDFYEFIELLISMLTSRAQRQVWCVRDDKDGKMVHAYVHEYTDSELQYVIDHYDDAEHARYLASLGPGEVDDFTAHGEERLKPHRVPESDVPPHIEIVGCHWPRDLQTHKTAVSIPTSNA